MARLIFDLHSFQQVMLNLVHA